MAEEKKEPEKSLHVIRMAKLDDRGFPFETRQGVFHSYTYVPFLGWIPPTELMILVAAASLLTAIVVPQVQKFRHRHEPPPAEAAAPQPDPPRRN